MKKIYILIFMLSSFLMTSQSNITFSVDMSGQTFTQAYISGSFNSWSGDSNPLTDMGGGIWEVTLPIADGEHEYKFTYDNWTGQDTFTQGDVCTITNYGNTNRRLVVSGADQVLATAPFNGCAEATDGIDPNHNVTFSVDMNGYGGTLGTVYINGEWNGWCGACNALTDLGGGIWGVTLPLDEKAFQFKFTVDGWNDQETFNPGDLQTSTDGTFTNRYIKVDGDKNVSYVWNQPQVLGINEFSTVNYKVFPNPTQNVWTLQTNNQNIIKIDLYDMLGKLVLTISPNTNEVNIDASSLVKGLYFARISNNNGVNTVKLIKN